MEIEDGLAVIQVEFQSDSDPVRKRDDVLREIAALRPDLPAELVKLEVQQFKAADVNIVEVGLIGHGARLRALDDVARSLKRRLESLEGVGEVEISGLPKQEVSVLLDLPRIAVLGISPLEVIQAIGAENANLPAGHLDADSRRFNVKTSGDYGSVDEIGATVVRSVGNAVVRVRDLAEVKLREAEQTEIARLDGQSAVLISAAQKEGQNIMNVSRRIDIELDVFRAGLPPGIALGRAFQADSQRLAPAQRSGA